MRAADPRLPVASNLRAVNTQRNKVELLSSTSAVSSGAVSAEQTHHARFQQRRVKESKSPTSPLDTVWAAQQSRAGVVRRSASCLRHFFRYLKLSFGSARGRPAEAGLQTSVFTSAVKKE